MVAESDKTVPTRSISFQVVINKSKHSRIAWLTGLSAYCKSYTLCGNLLGGTKLKQREWWPSFSMWCIAYPNPLFYTNSKQQQYHLQCKYLCPFPPGWYVLFHPPPGCPSSLPHSIARWGRWRSSALQEVLNQVWKWWSSLTWKKMGETWDESLNCCAVCLEMYCRNVSWRTKPLQYMDSPLLHLFN